MELVEEMLEGSQRALSRLITLAEDQSPQLSEVMKAVYPHLGKAYSIGVTGPPGAGKSTLVDQLTAIIRSRGLSVGVIAVDPTSPFTGGAILGDRIRMQQHYLDSEVFIRSMASRGSRGGLPSTTRNVMKLLDAFGKDIILVETVGVGQTELDIMDTVDTTIVALVPEAGDAIQMMKAGLMEIADIFVVNKADRPGADRLVTQSTLMMRGQTNGCWETPVLAAQAANNIGIEELYQAAERHQAFLVSSGKLSAQRQQQRRDEFFHTVEQGLRMRIAAFMKANDRLENLMEQVERGDLDPYSAFEVMEKEAFAQGPWNGNGIRV